MPLVKNIGGNATRVQTTNGKKLRLEELLEKEIAEKHIPEILARRGEVIDLGDGAQIIRTHDVAETVQAVRMAEIFYSRKTHGQ